MTQQLPLGFNDRYRDTAISVAVRRELRAVADEVGLKALAADLDRGHSELRRAFDEDERHYLRLDEVVAIMRRDTTGRVLRVLAVELGYEVSKRRELSADEKLERIQAELERNPALARVVYEGAFGPGGKP